MTKREYNDGTPTVSYSYDASGIAYSAGHLTSVTSSVSTTSYAGFDALGRVTASSQKTDGQTYSMNYEYDLAGNLKSETYPTGRVIHHTVDAAGRFNSVIGSKGITTTAYASQINYAPHGAVTSLKLGNTTSSNEQRWEHTTFNSRLQPTEMGAFFRAAKKTSAELNRNLILSGAELDPIALEEAKASGLSDHDLSQVKVTDFVLDPPRTPISAIVGNPPYIRHHRLSEGMKSKLRQLSIDIIGTPLDGRAGLHVHFLVRALHLLADNGRLAFIMPADTCEGIFSSILWKWITANHRLDAVLTFTPEAAPFQGIDTNAIIFLIRKTKPTKQFFWAQCLKYGTSQLKEWVHSGFNLAGDSLLVQQRDVIEGISTGLSRPPSEMETSDQVLGNFARVMRGIATGANEFFFLTTDQASDLKLPEKFLIPAVGRTRDVPDKVIDTSVIKALEKAGRPTLLFSPDNQPIENYTKPMRDYLRRGEDLGLPHRSLIAQRKPWYKMEVRTPPPFLFSYLGRRNTRFIRNVAGVMPLTGFLCIYPLQSDEGFINKLWRILQHPSVIKNLALVGKSYGAGAIKVEPRGLERLRLPPEIVFESGISRQSISVSLKAPNAGGARGH